MGKIYAFRDHLIQEEKSILTVQKYERDVCKFLGYLDKKHMKEEDIIKETVIEFKEILIRKFQPNSVNSMLAAVNKYLDYIGKSDCKVKRMRIQKQLFMCEERNMTRDDYKKLIDTAREKGKYRLEIIMETLCGTGIRVSELEFFTVERIKAGRIQVQNKGKNRMILMPKILKQKLLLYINKMNIQSGYVFTTRSGGCVDRSNLWREIQLICKEAGVNVQKGFPHNFRHLFAKVFYSIQKDAVKLADLLGHSSLETTRIYTASSFKDYVKQLELMNLVTRDYALR